MSTQHTADGERLTSPDSASPTPLMLDLGARVHCRSLSLAGGTGTVERWDDRLVWVRLDSGALRQFLPAAVTVLP